MKKKMREYDELKSELQNFEKTDNLNDSKKKLQKKIDYDLL